MRNSNGMESLRVRKSHRGGISLGNMEEQVGTATIKMESGWGETPDAGEASVTMARSSGVCQKSCKLYPK